MWSSAIALFALVHATLLLALPQAGNKGEAFSADVSINVAGIVGAARKANKVIAAFSAGSGGGGVKILKDWLDLPGISAFSFFGDMDVDCDGVDFKCEGSTSSQPQTSFGHLSASRVPYFVVPETFFRAHKSIKPNALGAIVCGGKMFYAIMGDTNGSNPQIIGEASILLAQTCFPNERLNGARGHTAPDVLYIVFENKAPPGVGDQTIDIAALKKLGDQSVKELVTALQL